jgi:hypothetical protein
MAISYPLIMPTHTGIKSVAFTTSNAVAYSRSPFTFAGKAYAFAGQMLQAEISLPPMTRTDAERWLAWLISLKGQVGTFYLGDPLASTPMGSARNADTIQVNGALSSGDVIDIDGAPVNQTDYLKAGDYMQVGSGSSRQLFKVLADVSTDSSGQASVDVWPNVRTSIANNSAVTVESTKGLFRLSGNEQSWNINEASIYGINFSAMEAL